MSKILLLANKNNNESQNVCKELARERHQVDLLFFFEWLPETRYQIYSSIILDMRQVTTYGRCSQFCDILRSNCRQPIMVLAEAEKQDEKVACINSGVDEFMLEPLNLEEMRAKLRALLRRHPEERDLEIHIADLHLNGAACRVRRGSEYIELFPMEFKLLEFLMSHPDTIFSAEVLHERLWHSFNVQRTDTVRTHMKTLRRKIDKDRSRPLIKTVHGKGYKLLAS